MPASQYGPMFRDASIRISGDFVRDVPVWVLPLIGVFGYALADAGKNANGIKTLLNNRGWIVDNVSDQSGWFSGDDIFQIDAVVAINYSDAEIQASLRTALADLFIVTGISMVTPPYTVPAGTTPTNPYVPPATYTPQPGAAQPPAGNNNSGGQPDAWNAFWNGLGMTAAPSVATVAIAGMIVVVLMTRR